MSESSWSRVGDLAPKGLTDARLQLHHAVQIAVSGAISYLESRSDDSHTALAWSTQLCALETELVAPARPFRIGVRIEDLTLLAIGGPGTVTSSFELSGRTVAEAHAWLSAIAAESGLDPRALTSRKHYTIPDHRVGHGAPFSTGSGAELHELTRYWSNASAILEVFRRATPGASEVRTWPHHFDIATLITPPGSNPGTIGVGQSPGDESYDEPYWYVTPSPRPVPRDLPPLAGGGHWHADGWFGAVLPASEFVSATDQRAQVKRFIASAVDGCRRLLMS
jgi:hypothetical protein